MTRGRNLAAAAALAVALAAVPLPVRSAEWRVSPIRLDLGRDARSGVVTVTNEGDERLQVQMKAFEWTQDGEGRDRYEETGEIVFFPRIMVFDRAEERILRAGIRIPAAAREKTYRLFIEEIPEPKKAEGTGVAVAIRFGVPVFVKPLKEEPKGEIASVGMAEGVFEALVRNTGNVHFIIRSIRVRGKNPRGDEIFSRELGGWYLLAGASRPYRTDVPGDVCADLAKIEAEVVTDKLTLNGTLDADRAMCAP